MKYRKAFFNCLLIMLFAVTFLIDGKNILHSMPLKKQNLAASIYFNPSKNATVLATTSSPKELLKYIGLIEEDVKSLRRLIETPNFSSVLASKNGYVGYQALKITCEKSLSPHVRELEELIAKKAKK